MAGGDTIPALFVGEYDHVLDAQGRVALPSDWRSRDGETELMMIPAWDKALLLIPQATFVEFAGKVGTKHMGDKKIQLALALLGRASRRCRCDKQGRMALDRGMLDSIGVEKKLKLIGAVNHIRICAPENWKLPDNPDEYLNMIQQISGGRDGLEALGGLLQGVFGK